MGAAVDVCTVLGKAPLVRSSADRRLAEPFLYAAVFQT